MELTCQNYECKHTFILNNLTDFETRSIPSGNHTTQYLYEGTVICPKCKYEMDVEIITDELNDTDEILSLDIKYR